MPLRSAVLAGVAANAADEGPVNLQFVKRQAIEIGQGGIARAKIINRQFDANALQAFQNSPEPAPSEVSANRLSVSLKAQHRRWQTRFQQDLLDFQFKSEPA